VRGGKGLSNSLLFTSPSFAIQVNGASYEVELDSPMLGMAS